MWHTSFTIHGLYSNEVGYLWLLSQNCSSTLNWRHSSVHSIRTSFRPYVCRCSLFWFNCVRNRFNCTVIIRQIFMIVTPTLRCLRKLCEYDMGIFKKDIVAYRCCGATEWSSRRVQLEIKRSLYAIGSHSTLAIRPQSWWNSVNAYLAPLRGFNQVYTTETPNLPK